MLILHIYAYYVYKNYIHTDINITVCGKMFMQTYICYEWYNYNGSAFHTNDSRGHDPL